MSSDGSFAAVYRQYVGPIRAYLARRVPFGEVEDLAADVFAVAWRKRDAVAAGEELPWLYTIASYTVANYRRKEKNRLDVLWLFTIPDSAPAADSFLEGDPELAGAWTSLSVAEREILALVVLDGLPVQDAARVLGVSPNAASIRLYRAKKSLAAALPRATSERNDSEGT